MTTDIKNKSYEIFSKINIGTKWTTGDNTSYSYKYTGLNHN